MWYTLSPALFPMSEMSRDFDEVLVWDSGAIMGTVRTVLLVEWLGIIIQSVLFFSMFVLRRDFIKDVVDQMRATPDVMRTCLLRMCGQDGTNHGFWMGSAVRYHSTPAPVFPVAIFDFTMAAGALSTASNRRCIHR
ncbi:hypothetical protein EDC04DRAFT_3142659 [Pisolithus marmoratus]|nr:hypothetical protein EDC04DRAFT_3142659 [Pisolithus marmoratus]